MIDEEKTMMSITPYDKIRHIFHFYDVTFYELFLLFLIHFTRRRKEILKWNS